jgi:subtilisin family serine protease
VKGEILAIPLDSGGGSGTLAENRALPERARAAIARFGLDRVEALGRGPRTSGRVLKLSSSRPGLDVGAAAAELRASGAFRAVVPNFRAKLFATFPNDPDLFYQWSIESGDPADIDLPEAWDVAKGDSGTVIAIMDTGVDLGHPDLSSQIAINRGEIAGNSVDDDANGFVDDVYGWDFGDGDADPNPGPVFDEIGLDIGFHGTFCAGIASAATDNAEGIAGAGWNCRLLPLKVSDAAGEITSDAIAEAFLYAIDREVDVLSMSLGAAGGAGVPEFFQALVDLADSANVLCVAAAGNSGTDSPNYPAACDRVLAVAATDESSARAEFSNYGSWVDVAAPGAYMWSAIARNYEVDELSQLFYLFFFEWDGVRPYMRGDGTSFACPLTAGVCALVRSRQPYLTTGQVRNHIVATGDPIVFDQPIGPKVNAFRAVAPGLLAAEPAVEPRLRWLSIAPNPASAAVQLAFTLPRAGEARLTILDPAGRIVRDDGPRSSSAGGQVRSWDGRDARGRPAASGVYFARLEFEGQSLARRIVRLDP